MDIQILVAEDDPNSARLLRDFLNAKGFEHIDFASTGTDAIELSKQNSYDVAVVDLRLPGENGFTVSRHLKSEHSLSYPIIIVISAFSDDHNELQAYEAGADLFLSKPIHLKKFYLIMANIARRIERSRNSDPVSARESCTTNDDIQTLNGGECLYL